jgi:cell division septum initiation protein DivIVA
MYRRNELDAGAGGAADIGGGPDPAARGGGGQLGPALAAFRSVEPPGPLDRMLDHRPVFRRRRHGYDRAQVDNYVAWAEVEVDAARRQCDHLLERYGAVMAELALNRRTPVDTPTGAVSRRLGQLLRLASQEADEVVAAGVDEAQRIVDEARLDAQARLAKVTGIRDAAVAAGEHIRAQARDEARRLLAEATTQRQQAEAEVDDLRRQRDEARESLHRLTAQIGGALQAASNAPGDLPNIAVELPNDADRRPVGSTLG